MSNFVVPFWEEMNRIVAEEILASNNIDFLNHEVIRNCMYTNPELYERYTTQIVLLDHQFGLEEVERILNDEPDFGNPDKREYLNHIVCSGNSIQQLYHLAYWQWSTGKKITDVNSILEWGAGYGSLARLIKKIHPDVNYTIIDTDVFAKLQNWYFDNIDVDLRSSTVEEIDLDNLEIDLFISTWALSESSTEAIHHIAQRSSIINCPHFLLAYQVSQEKFESAGDIVDILNQYRKEPITDIGRVPYLITDDRYATR